MQTKPSDDELWESSLRANGRAFGLLFSRHRDRVFRHSLRFVESPADAEDLTAVVFLELWRNRDRVRIIDDSLLPWLLATTTNLARNASRARRRHRRLLAKIPPPEHVADHAATIGSRIDETGSDLSAALRGLPVIDQQLLSLTALEGYTTVQAAQAVGTSPGNARTRLSRARARLSQTIAGNLPAEQESS